MFNCPNCGAALRVDVVSPPMGGGWERGRTLTLGAPPSGAEYSREVPASDLSGVESGVKTPLFQALLTGAAVGAVMVILTIWKHWPWATPIVAAVIAAALAWWLLLLDTRGLLKTVETVINKDLDGDGRVGFTVEIVDQTDGKKQIRYASFANVKGEHLRRFAQAAIDVRLTPEGARLSRRQFNVIRDESIKRGLLCWRAPEHHAQGVEVTNAGRHVFQHLLEEL